MTKTHYSSHKIAIIVRQQRKTIFIQQINENTLVMVIIVLQILL